VDGSSRGGAGRTLGVPRGPVRLGRGEERGKGRKVGGRTQGALAAGWEWEGGRKETLA